VVTLPQSLVQYSTWFFFSFFYCSPPHPDLHSFPTRRSSDLEYKVLLRASERMKEDATCRQLLAEVERIAQDIERAAQEGREPVRSEEHTSELQSRFDLVCRLLLEKKKKNNKTQQPYRVTKISKFTFSIHTSQHECLQEHLQLLVHQPTHTIHSLV